jgi:hypothetical protein
MVQARRTVETKYHDLAADTRRILYPAYVSDQRNAIISPSRRDLWRTISPQIPIPPLLHRMAPVSSVHR